MSLDFQRLEQVLAEAAARADPAERAAYLDVACGEDRELRAEVERLLAANEKAGDFLETPVQPSAQVTGEGHDVVAADSAKGIEGPGSVIGRYKLLEEIGEGGFGVVYMAEQTEPVQRKVALKIVKAGMDTREVVARFEAERQALALMDHPSIARVFDGGVTQGGRPYFVMELVRGIPITEFCDQRKLSTQERLRLFIQVCHAVQHAHQKGIIHRDLKPTNILVTLIDGEPVPKVIDFGVAKALGQRLTDKTLFTGFLKMIGTPAYMSPEQADLSGVDIDTRADIYALGVLLYELLTGVTPFDSETLRNAALDEIRRMIRETEPPKPSTRLQTLVAVDVRRLTSRSEADRASLRRLLQERKGLINLLRGDLDWIVMKCLEKDRGRRYETANGLASDIERHLNHEPVTAAAPSSFYRAQKFIGRHKTGLTVAAALVSLLVAGVIVSTWQAVRATRAERAQALLRQEAEQAREQVEARSYASEISMAAHSANLDANLGSVQNLLSRWRNREPDRRGWEWYYLNGLCHHDLLTIDAHSNGVMSVAWNPNGRWLASSGADGVVKLWDASTGHKIAELPGRRWSTRGAVWSPDGRQLATTRTECGIRVWDAETTNPLLSLADSRDLVVSVAWSLSGTKLASTHQDHTLRVWETATGSEALTVPLEEPTTDVSWDPSGSRLAVCSDVRTWVFDAVTGKRLLTLPAGFGLAVSWSPDGRWLATGGHESMARITDVLNGTNTVLVARHKGGVRCVAWSPDGTRLASTSMADGTVKVGNVETGAEVQSFRGHEGGVRSVCWRPDGKQIASAGIDGKVRVWDLARSNPSLTVKTQAAQVFSLTWHPDGRQLASGASDGSVRVWNPAGPREPLIVQRHNGWVRQVAWSPDGTQLASGGSGSLIQVWESISGGEGWNVQAYNEVRGEREGVRSLAWSPDGQRLASVAQDRYLRIWDTTNRALLAAHDLQGITSFAVAWAPNGQQLVIEKIGEIQVLDGTSGKLQKALRGHRDVVRSLAWTPDGQQLASASDDTTVKVWHPEKGREIHTLFAHSSQVYSVAWSPDGTRLASASLDGTVRIWDAASGQQVCSLAEAARNPWIFSVAWSPDGTRIASSDIHGRILIYDSTPGRAAEEKRKRVEPEAGSVRNPSAQTIR